MQENSIVLKMEITSLFHHLRQKHTVKNNWAMKEKMLAASDARPKFKQMAQPCIAGALVNCTSCKWKSKRWV